MINKNIGVNMQTKQTYLMENDLFRGLPPAEIAALGERAPMKRVSAGTLFYTAEQPVEVLFILKQGRVRLYRLAPDGRALTTAVLEAGSVFGEMALLGQNLHESFAEAIDPCLICLMSRHDVQTLLLGDPRIAVRIAEILGTRLIAAQEQLSDFAFKRVPERLVTLLLRLGRKSRALFSTEEVFEVRHTHEELAEMIGVQRETVSKILGEWVAQGFVRLGRGKVTVTQPEALRNLASK